MSLNIRPMEIEDISEIMEIENSSFKKGWTENLFYQELTSNDDSYYFVMEESGETLGYAGLWNMVGEGHVTVIAVNEKHRGRGIGRKLMERLIFLGVELGTTGITLEVRVDNIPAIELYTSLGFSIVGKRPNYYSEDGSDAYIMWRYEGSE
ncbi:MAG: ribosomal protein S18-alanine N-acetyltransferase [Tissierellia bacterium]|nr:ribosomal protein S18-alanine N-acetyltransferase [Tissierellia bacterium]